MNPAPALPPPQTTFQSHIGAIRIETDGEIKKVSFIDFNPTLVQLELRAAERAVVARSHFNPTLVQLE